MSERLDIDFDRVYTEELVRSGRLYFSSHFDMPGTVELHLPGYHRTLKLTAAAAEALLTNLGVNSAAARGFAKVSERKT